ncbi:MAG TPA: GyrI-like domain-containing protein [Spirochaetota bacterium]|nr:GyrI-like domain-containing protein [Spirochaetota bacterium]HNT10573.1 GyrI-like domain-containing protein [Spirochaetota bacterium]HNV49272.1 GyrI-like domain-containing protein [Spirochaetota bacterium]HOS41035.1 GyrI-like domain-containing protein [Spirochaetota bacterium]HPI23951.1 GyrI-like domain-containing protein [Spirochaetota bacterium]
MKKAIGIGIVVVAGSFIFLVYNGVFNDMKVSEAELGPFTFVFERHRGPYHATGPLFAKVSATLAGDLACAQLYGIGVYYDDPRTVAPEALRSDIGYAIEKPDADTAIKIAARLAVRDIPRTRYAVIAFPFKNRLSVMIGAMKAYDPLYGYVSRQGYRIAPAMELYDRKGGTILYAVPLAR